MVLPLQQSDKWTLKTDYLSFLSIEQHLGHRDSSDVFFKLHPAVSRVCSLLRNKCQAKERCGLSQGAGEPADGWSPSECLERRTVPLTQLQQSWHFLG